MLILVTLKDWGSVGEHMKHSLKCMWPQGPLLEKYLPWQVEGRIHSEKY